MHGVNALLLLLSLPLQARSFSPAAHRVPLRGARSPDPHNRRHPPPPRRAGPTCIASLATRNSDAAEAQGKVLVIGGTGFVGRHVVDLLEKKDIPYLSTSTDGRTGTIVLDLTDADAAQSLLAICRGNGVSTIVSTAGSIFTERDYEVNSASGRTAAAAFSSSDDKDLPKYVFIGNSPRVRNVCNVVSSLSEYGRGKEESERLIEDTFGDKAFIVKPVFIYGGDGFGLNPPRLPAGIGEIVEALLGLYPIQATCEFLPDILGVARRRQ